MACVKEKNRTDKKDEDTIFCELLASQLRKFDLPDKLMIRMKISQSIYEHKMRTSTAVRSDRERPTTIRVVKYKPKIRVLLITFSTLKICQPLMKVHQEYFVLQAPILKTKECFHLVIFSNNTPIICITLIAKHKCGSRAEDFLTV